MEIDVVDSVIYPTSTKQYCTKCDVFLLLQWHEMASARFDTHKQEIKGRGDLMFGNFTGRSLMCVV